MDEGWQHSLADAFLVKANTLQPYEDKASFYLSHLSARTTSFFEDTGEQVASTFFSGPVVYLQRASGLSVEVLLLDEKVALYLLAPNSIESVEKAVQAQLRSFDKEECKGWQMWLLVFVRVEIPKLYDAKACVERARLFHCGDFAVGSNEGEKYPQPTHRLYMAAFQLDVEHGKVIPFA